MRHHTCERCALDLTGCSAEEVSRRMEAAMAAMAECALCSPVVGALRESGPAYSVENDGHPQGE